MSYKDYYSSPRVSKNPDFKVFFVIFLIAVVCGLFCGGCSTHTMPGPGYDITPAWASLFGCSLSDVQRVQEERIEDGGYFIPHVGQTACRVLGRTGVPGQRSAITEGRYFKAVIWYYYPEGRRALVFLEQRPGADWLVTSVRWR